MASPLRALGGSPPPTAQLLEIGRQIADALAAAHHAGIVHRDIKPENIMLRPNGCVKVLDFGLARPAPGYETASYQSVSVAIPAGTWRYMSPEHYRNEPVTAKSDIFALGLVLYEVSTGCHPFSADSPFETLHAIATTEPVHPAELNRAIPQELASAILSMLAKTPADRPRAAAVIEALRTIEHTLQVQRSLQPVRSLNPRLLTLAAFAGFLLFAALFFSYRLSRKPLLEWRQLTSLLPENHATAAAISPDGRFIAYANADGIFLRNVKTGETTPLDAPRSFAVDHLAWLPDSTRMVASGFSEQTNRPALWSISIMNSRAQELRSGARFGIPSPDGSRVAFLSEDYGSIWIMGSAGEEPRRILSGAREDSFRMVVWSPDGGFLVFQRRHYSGNVDNGIIMFDRFYERSLESVDANTGRVVSRLPNFWVAAAAVLPRNRLLLLRFESAGSPYANQLWEVRVNPNSGRFAESARKAEAPEDDGKGRIVGVSATADGSVIAAQREHGQATVFVAEFDPAVPQFLRPRCLTLDERSSYPHAWTADSQSVIFESNRNGSWDIFRQRTNDRVPDLIVGTPKRSEVLPQLSPDGRYVLYAQSLETRTPPYTLMRIPIEGGPSEQVPAGGALDEFRCSLLAPGRCVIRRTLDRQFFVYSELDPVHGIGKELARSSWQDSLTADWDVSPDGTSIALPNHDSRTALIRVIPLAPVSNQMHERVVAVKGLANISGLTWSADGQGWFVSIITSIGSRVFHCDLSGTARPMGDINGWVVPARDGKNVAYENTLFDRNVWSFSRR